MTADRHQLTDADVWTLMTEGCNEREISTYAEISMMAARARMRRAYNAFTWDGERNAERAR